MLGLYFGFLLSLSGWTLISCPPTLEAGENFLFYMFTLLLLSVLALHLEVFCFESNMYLTSMGVLVLANTGASLAYRMQSYLKVNHSQEVFWDFLFSTIIFIVVWFVARYLEKIYRWKWLNLLYLVLLPLVFLVARLGKPVGGSYLTVHGVLVFGIVLAIYPFAAAFLLTRKNKKHLFGTVRSMSFPLFCFLLFTFLLYCGCILINEFGILLILGCTSTALFYISSKNLRTKLLYTGLGAGGAILAASCISHIHKRVFIWLHLSEITPSHELAGEAESVLYLFRNFHRTGIWGDGLGSVPLGIYPTLNTDHAMVAILLEYSAVFFLELVLTGWVVFKGMNAAYQATTRYDYLLNFSCALIFGAILLIDLGSILGSSITAGIGYPFVSEGGSVNMMLAVLLGVHAGVYGRGKENDLQKET